jgi:cyclophilin family peptidyl-prolyl cis-trans isomerase
VRDADRRVRTEAVRALGSYTDSTSLRALLGALASRDAWVAVSAAEGLGRVRAAEALPALVTAATNGGRSCAVRITALQAVQAYAPNAIVAAAIGVAGDTVPYCRTVALQTLLRAAAAGPIGSTAQNVVSRLREDPVASIRLLAHQVLWAARDVDLDGATRRDVRQRTLGSADAAARAGALRSMTAWADTSDLGWLLDQYEQARADSSPVAASAAVAVIGAVQRRAGVGAAAFFARFPAPPSDPLLRRDVDRAFEPALRTAWPPAARAERPLAEYRAIVERWVVPDHLGRPRPRARWETPRGTIELELYPGDAPLATDDFVRTMNSGAIVGTDFIRVVPDFVDQQRPIVEGNVLRDEVNRHRLTRGNLAWATAGLDTGTPGYTLNHTPQPHNEGDFTSLGRVVRGQDVVDRIELGDRVTAGRMLERPR